MTLEELTVSKLSVIKDIEDRLTYLSGKLPNDRLYRFTQDSASIVKSYAFEIHMADTIEEARRLGMDCEYQLCLKMITIYKKADWE